ncbi:MAG: AAA family ATPase [Ardenticatenaceae bacterium]|nr:AAA family ATPase [Ardenticatenaceae bacterium]
MLTKHQIHDLIDLVRRRFPDWDGFAHPPFVDDEVAYKQTAVSQAQELINQPVLDDLLAKSDTDTILARLTTLCNQTNLLWQRIPSTSDSAVLRHPSLNAAEFCAQFRNLLYGDQPSPQRLQYFSDYLEANGLPNGWPFSTYFLFLCHPAEEMFVKPHTAAWLLKFFGYPDTKVERPPTAATYANILAASRVLLNALASYEAADMIDVQSLVWVCYQESRARVGQLSSEGQIALDIPPAEDEIMPANTETTGETILHESPASYTAQSPTHPVYTLEDCADDTSLELETLKFWLAALRRKGQAILYGPPGTGKTFLARKLAKHLVSNSNGNVELVQFHPAYSYEEFIQGLRPLSHSDGTLHYEMVPGRFLRFCRQASSSGEPHVFIIDEINRANLTAVFGELMYLLEYRDEEVGLAGGNGRLSIPSNVTIIGTMNTADRSIALVDYALRRRFAFLRLTPNLDLLRRYHAQLGTSTDLIERLITQLKQLNHHINDPNYAIGPTYFLTPNLANLLPAIWTLEIEPYLEEYFFDQPQQIAPFRWDTLAATLLP